MHALSALSKITSNHTDTDNSEVLNIKMQPMNMPLWQLIPLLFLLALWALVWIYIAIGDSQAGVGRLAGLILGPPALLLLLLLLELQWPGLSCRVGMLP